MPSGQPLAAIPGAARELPSRATSFPRLPRPDTSRSMADSTSAATTAAPVPEPEAVARAERFTLERFVHAGEDPADALAPGTGRRLALDAALAELDAGADVPSTHWRRRYSLLLGLERVLSEDEPRLADGTTLNPHQVDALSGTLTALLAEAQRDGEVSAPVAAPVLAVDEEPEDAPLDSDDEVPDAEFDLDLEDEDDGEDEEDEPAPEPEAEAYEDEPPDEVDEDVADGVDDPNAHKRFWFEHATGAGKTVAAMGFVEASRTGGILILTHRRNLVDQFNGELRDRGYADRATPPLLTDNGGADATKHIGPVTVETYQWFVRNAGRISDAYTIVICDEAHTALGEKTSAAIRAWTGPIFIGMTATGALIARHVTDLFPTQTSRFDLAQAARRGVIAPLRDIRIPPGPGVRTIAKVPLRRGDVDVEFDQEMLAELLDQLPFNMAIADLYKTRFNGVPGVISAAGVRHAYNVAEAMRQEGINAEAVSGETPKRELAEILAKYEHGDIDVLVNAQLLAEGWNSPRATVCMHLAPTASKRIYQQRVGRVTRRHPGKEAGVVVDFVHPATKHDDPVVTLHSLLDRDVYRGGAIVVGPVRRGRGRRLRVERRVVPVTSDENRRIEVFERELWRIAVEHLDYGEQVQWAALAGGRRGGAGRRPPRAGGGLAPRAGDVALRPGRGAQARLPADGDRTQQEPAAASACAPGGRRLARRGGLRPRARLRGGLAARGEARGRQGGAAGARRQEDRPPRPGQQLDLALREHDARGARGVRRAALARDQAPARPARHPLRERARAQPPRAGARAPPAGPPAQRGAARGGDPAHRRGRRGHQRRPDAHVPQARRAGPRAAAELPEGQDAPHHAAPAAQGRRRARAGGRGAGRRRAGGLRRGGPGGGRGRGRGGRGERRGRGDRRGRGRCGGRR